MKTLKAILVLLSGAVVQGANYYVATNGSNANPGTIGQPWLTLQYGVDNTPSGSTLNVGPGYYNEDVLVLTTNITIVGSVDTNNVPTSINDPSIFASSWSAASEIGANVFKVTGLGFETKHLMIDEQRVPHILTTNDIKAGMDLAYVSSGISNGVQLLTSSTNIVFNSGIQHQDVTFWDSVHALWASTNGTTYLRLKDGSNPTNVSVRISGNLDNSWTDDPWKRGFRLAANDVTLKNFKVRGAWCNILIYNNAARVTVDNCYISTGRYRLYVNLASDITIKNCNFTTAWYGYTNWGAWQGLSTTGSKENGYLVSKYLMQGAFIGDTDLWIRGASNVWVYGNTFSASIGDAIVVGDPDYPDQNVNISSNLFVGTSGHGVFFLPRQTNTLEFLNIFYDSNVHNRLQQMDNGDERTIYIYRNLFYNPAGAGEWIYGHFSDTLVAAYPQVWIYHNSVSGGSTGIDATPGTASGLNGCRFVNNIISGAPWLTTYSVYFFTNTATVGAFDYNEITPPAVTYPSTNSPGWWGANNKTAAAIEWDTNSIPSFTLQASSLAVNNGLDVTTTFTLAGTNYNALPSSGASRFGANWDIGALESTWGAGKRLITGTLRGR